MTVYYHVNVDEHKYLNAYENKDTQNGAFILLRPGTVPVNWKLPPLGTSYQQYELFRETDIKAERVCKGVARQLLNEAGLAHVGLL